MKLKKMLATAALLAFTLVNYSFKPAMNEQDWLTWTNNCLNESYNQAAEPKLKKVEITLTNDYFIRLHKTYVRNKVVYYSFNLSQFSDMNYLGSADNGVLALSAKDDDIIVQTYHDRHGDIDSMTTTLEIPVKNMNPDRLDSLHQALEYFRSKSS